MPGFRKLGAESSRTVTGPTGHGGKSAGVMKSAFAEPRKPISWSKKANVSPALGLPSPPLMMKESAEFTAVSVSQTVVMFMTSSPSFSKSLYSTTISPLMPVKCVPSATVEMGRP